MNTLGDNLRAVFPYWWVVVVGGVIAFSDLYKWHVPDFLKELKFPYWLRLTVSLGAVVVAQFFAYRDQANNLRTVIAEKKTFAIQLDAGRDELASTITERDALKAEIPDERSLKLRALSTANEFEQFWRKQPKEPVCNQTSSMTPEEQRKAIQPCVDYMNMRTGRYQQVLAPKIMAIVAEFKAKGANVLNIENCAPVGFCGTAVVVQLKALSQQLGAHDCLKGLSCPS